MSTTPATGTPEPGTSTPAPGAGIYVIAEASGQQFWFQPNRYYDLDRIGAEVDESVTLENVLLVIQLGVFGWVIFKVIQSEMMTRGQRPVRRLDKRN